MSDVINRRDLKRPLITDVSDLPDFDCMDAEDVVLWWETHEVTAEVLSQLPEGDLDADIAELQD